MIWLALSITALGLSVLALIFLHKKFGFIEIDKPLATWKENIPQIAGNHTQVTGVLAGFSITVVVLIAALKLEGDQLSSEFLEQLTLGMFMIAFFGYVGAGILYSLVAERSDTHSYFLFTTASVLYYLSVLMSFSALLPLLELMRAGYLRTAISILVASSAVGGYLAMCIPLVDLLRLRCRLCAVVFVLIVSAIGIYLSLGQYFPQLCCAEAILKGNLYSSVVVMSLVSLVSLSSFFYSRLTHETTLTWATALAVWLGTANVIYTSSITILSIGV